MTPIPAATKTRAGAILLTLSISLPGLHAQQLAPRPLWPGAAPLATGAAEPDVPTLTAFLPTENPTGTAVVIAPGGGYRMLSLQHEGDDVAHWMNAHGIAAFVLKYRLGPRYHHPAELLDAQRALRTVRAQAAAFGLHADRIGIMGFSAGGHLAAVAGTLPSGALTTGDAVDHTSARPDFLILAYPVITMAQPYVHKGSRDALLGDAPTPALLDLLSAEKQVGKHTPPTFLFATSDDTVVPVQNSVLFYTALLAAGVPAEMHLYAHGAHGAGLAADLAANQPQLATWPNLLAHWMQSRGYMAQEQSPVLP